MTENVYDDTPGRFDIRIYKGSSFGKDWSIEIPDLSDQGGPSSLTEEGVSVVAQLRYDVRDEEPAATFDCQVLSETDPMEVRPYLTRQQTAELSRDFGYWSLEVQWGAADNEAILAGEVEITGDPTREATA